MVYNVLNNILIVDVILGLIGMFLIGLFNI